MLMEAFVVVLVMDCASNIVSPAGPVCSQPVAVTVAPTGASAVTCALISGGKCATTPRFKIRPST
jgi:hypothetical protein